VARDAVSRLERDVAKTVEPRALVRLAATYRLDLTWLLTGKGEPYINVSGGPSGPDSREPTADDSSPEHVLEEAYRHVKHALAEHRVKVAEHEAQIARLQVAPIKVVARFRLLGHKRDLERAEGAHWTENLVAVPLLTDAVAAGNPREVNDRDIEGYAVVYASWVENVDTTRCVRVRGDSMERLLPDKSIVGLDLAQRDPRLLDNRIVAARVGDGVTIKWLRVHDDMLCLQPENQAHKIICLHPNGGDENPIIGRVTWWWAHAP